MFLHLTGHRAEPSADDNETVAAVVAWTLRALLVVVVVAAIVLIALALARRLRRDPVTVKDEVRGGLLPDVLVAGVRESEAQLDVGTSGEAVINAWLTLERTAHAVGIDDSGTMEFMVRFARGERAAIGFHDIPVDRGRRVQTRAHLGTPLSHGCVRQAAADARALWRFAPVGTPVVVTG